MNRCSLGGTVRNTALNSELISMVVVDIFLLLRKALLTQPKEYDTWKMPPRLSPLDTVDILCRIETMVQRFFSSETKPFQMIDERYKKNKKRQERGT